VLKVQRSASVPFRMPWCATEYCFTHTASSLNPVICALLVLFSAILFTGCVDEPKRKIIKFQADYAELREWERKLELQDIQKEVESP